jgi:hypothetical protein
MMTFEEFADPKKHPFDTLESKIAQAYRKTIEELESANRDLLKTIHTEQTDNLQLVYFDPDYEIPLLRIDELEMRLKEIQSDIENFMRIMGSHSRHDVAQRLNHCKLDIANAKRQARNIRKKAIQENLGMSLEDIEKLDVVQVSFSNRDSIITKLTPVMAGLEEKLTDAEEILKKYV